MLRSSFLRRLLADASSYAGCGVGIPGDGFFEIVVGWQCRRSRENLDRSALAGVSSKVSATSATGVGSCGRVVQSLGDFGYGRKLFGSCSGEIFRPFDFAFRDLGDGR